MPTLANLNLPVAFSKHLDSSESLINWAYGFNQPIVWSIFVTSVFIFIAILSAQLIHPFAGVFFIFCTLPFNPLRKKSFIVGLTNQRIILIRIKYPIFKIDPNHQLSVNNILLNMNPSIKLKVGKGFAKGLFEIDGKLTLIKFPYSITGNREQLEAISIQIIK